MIEKIYVCFQQKGSKFHLRCGLTPMKSVCPKMKWEYDKTATKSKRVCHYENPCTEKEIGIAC